MNNPGSSQPNIHPEILHLIKSGGHSLVQNYIKELQQPEYPMDFVTFMDQMIDESKMDRKTIIARSGLSESLAYKYLNGNKRTTERDYILALCIAMHLSFPQTQHALRCSGLPLLGIQDCRAILIRMGIDRKLDRYQIDEYLENQGLPLIKISSDMPSAEIKDSYSEISMLRTIKSESPAYPSPQQSIQFADEDQYEIIESSAKATHYGDAPIDFNYFGSMTLKSNTGITYHLRADYYATGETIFCVMSDEQYEVFKETEEEYESFDSEEFCIFPETEEDLQIHTDTTYNLSEDNLDESEEPDALEIYSSLLDATASSFFPYFMELDHLTDQKVAEVMTKLDDTRNYRYRVGSHIIGEKGPEIYIEMFNTSEPERHEYYQIIENTKHKYTYTASHESYFMQIEMSDVYEVYFQKQRKPEYFLEAADDDFIKLDKRYQIIFNHLRHYLHTSAREIGGFVEIPDKQFYEEETIFFAELFELSMHNGDIAQAKHALIEQEKAINAQIIPAAKELALLSILDMRKLHLALSEEKTEEANQIRETIIYKKQKALKLKNEMGTDASTVFTIIATALLGKWRTLQQQDNPTHSKEILDDILELMDHGAFSDEENDCSARFELYQAYAFQLDQTNPEEAEIYYLKALKEATKHHLDQEPQSAAVVASVYNNYAWVLWNKLGCEEAIIYYGRAIELAETYLENGIIIPEHARKNLAHYGAALLGLYRDTGRIKEHDRLFDRLVKNGVTLDEE